MLALRQVVTNFNSFLRDNFNLLLTAFLEVLMLNCANGWLPRVISADIYFIGTGIRRREAKSLFSHLLFATARGTPGAL